jgi:crotonobetainyl-CoA:carnitine CoA-transferase CaiB-like acyl-CoA transferase
LTLPLSNVRVLDLTRLLPGGYCTQLLADMGADVIKIEEPGRGDYIRWSPPMVGEYSAAHWVLNRNKRSVTLNLKQPEGKDLFLKLCETANVVVEGFRPGVMDRLGLGYEAIKSRNPRIVYCSISGYGQSGPYAAKAGHDINYIGYAGLLGFTGTPEGRPVLPGVQIGDLGGGGLLPAVGILAGLIKAQATGEGDYVDIAMMDGVVSWLTIHAGKFFGGGGEPTWGSEVLNGAVPCYNLYRCADGRWITVGALEPQFWKAFCAALQRDDLVSRQFDRKAIEEVQEIISSKPRDEWLETFENYDACVGPVLGVAEAMDDPQVRHRKMVIEMEGPKGEQLRNLGSPVKFASDNDDRKYRPAPGLGEHNEEVLAEIGVDPAHLAELASKGIV